MKLVDLELREMFGYWQGLSMSGTMESTFQSDVCRGNQNLAVCACVCNVCLAKFWSSDVNDEVWSLLQPVMNPTEDKLSQKRASSCQEASFCDSL